ncbi:MAG: YegP family protein [Lewinellaceae bacterium]|nr:YegP family protein [Lewinellaceae bacterium]MCB9285916.1 YegP family protein [Lewinellaceae bacterium]
MKTSNYPKEGGGPLKYGFATFFKEDGKYYFQFNGKDGAPIFFSHGYQSERSRDNGIQVVIRNAADDTSYERQQSKKGEHFFLLRSGNNQEIGRSATFEGKAALEEKLNVMKSIAEDVPVFELAEEEAKTRVMEEEPDKPSSRELPIEKMPRYKFSIIYYPDSDVWAIKHDQSGNTKQFKNCDGELIEEFLKAHLPAEKARAALVPGQLLAQPKAPVQEGIPRKADKAVEEEIELKLRNFRGEEAQHFTKAGSLIRLEAQIKGKEFVPEQAYTAKVTARPLEGKEEIMLGEIEEELPRQGRFLIPIYGANNLRPGMYRFSVRIHQGKEGEEEHDYKGSRMVMLR